LAIGRLVTRVKQLLSTTRKYITIVWYKREKGSASTEKIKQRKWQENRTEGGDRWNSSGLRAGTEKLHWVLYI
jgi:hypothetical protein